MLIKWGVTTLLRSRVVNRAVRAAARVRGHRLVLVYHRVGVPPQADCQVLPTVPVDVFRTQLQALGEIADMVALDEILTPGNNQHPRGADRRRLAIALTFDDDLPSHVSEVLPILREMRMPAAFFLSGRALLGRGPYWFQQLEALLVRHGPLRTAALLEAPRTTAPLTLVCERNPSMRRRVAELSAAMPDPQVLSPDAIAELAAAGMTVGFHTVDHDILLGMDDASLGAAVNRGRHSLQATVGGRVRFFAYPHGKADARCARAVRDAGFDAAFTGHPGPVKSRLDRYLVGRWEPGSLGVGDLLAKLAVQLHRPSPTAANSEVGS
jgi:peptidoglycan/xylan/chitin deacetylase (PgdA/CDA1 family)